MRLNLTKQEYINMHEWHIQLRKYFTSSFDKIFMFHGAEDGSVNINKFILYFYYMMGYKFICCHPLKVSQNLGFGQFIWPEYDDRIYCHVETNSNGVYNVYVDLFSE